jgi:hypothetical protein
MQNQKIKPGENILAPDTTFCVVPGHLVAWTVENLLKAYAARQQAARLLKDWPHRS